MTAMTVAPAPTKSSVMPRDEQRLVLPAVAWETYTTIGDALDRHRGVRLIYREGTLTFMVKSRDHELCAERLGYLVAWLAVAAGQPFEPCGQMTLRRKDLNSGVEGDKAFYLGPNVERMRGVKVVNLDVDPPPDLAIEVEVTHSADEALATYALLGVPEVWRFDAVKWSFTFLRLGADRQYSESSASAVFPKLTAQHIIEQLKRAEEVGTAPWFTRLGDWARATFQG